MRSFLTTAIAAAALALTSCGSIQLARDSRYNGSELSFRDVQQIRALAALLPVRKAVRVITALSPNRALVGCQHIPTGALSVFTAIRKSGGWSIEEGSIRQERSIID